jgi:cellulose synthase/poly-beta-1,6-N-acetylglucosamine synthase-like glycosyltransferase
VFLLQKYFQNNRKNDMLGIYISICFFLTLAYFVIMAMYWAGWCDLKVWNLSKETSLNTQFSIIIPARNEAQNIRTCLESILLGNYPKNLYEILVIDDYSEDETANIVEDLAKKHSNIRLIRLSTLLSQSNSSQTLKSSNFQPSSPKKKAIETALNFAQGTHIVTTDADCLVQPDWLNYLASVFEQKFAIKMVAAPVAFYKEKNLLQRFQGLDFVGMMGITAAGIHWGFQRMGNGANLAYTKSVFEEVNGFEGVNDRASGDDMYLLQKVAHLYPKGVFFLKNENATVFTEAKEDLKSFVQQRIRWGSKNAAYPEKWVTILLATVFFFCWTLVFNLLLSPFFFGAFWLLLFQIAVKIAIDYFFLREMSFFFQKQTLLRWFLPSCFMHIAYIAWVGLASQLVKNYEWKGRKLR